MHVNTETSEPDSRSRRGPGIYRHSHLEQQTSQQQAVDHLNHAIKRVTHFKPSLTPGLGTRRVVQSNVGLDTRIRFDMEPKAGDEAFREWHEAIRLMARLGDGLPSFVRRRVWSALADRQLSKQHVDWTYVVSLAFTEGAHAGDESLGCQIVKDLHRTGCEQFGSEKDKAALQQVLLAYARWNKRVGYCQGFNVIAATILDVTNRDEKEAFKIMVYLIDYVLPESYFAQNLQALSVDIAVFRHLLQIRLPRLAAHLDRLQYKAALEINDRLGRPSIDASEFFAGRAQGLYEPPLMNVYAIQWFLTLFTTCLAPDAILRIWDSILLEGSEVVLRTAVVIMEFLASRLLKLKSADQFYSTMSELLTEFQEGHIVSTRELLFEIYQLAPFPYPNLKELREKFMYNVAPLVSASLPKMSTSSRLSCESVTNSRFRLIPRFKFKQKETSTEAAQVAVASSIEAGKKQYGEKSSKHKSPIATKLESIQQRNLQSAIPLVSVECEDASRTLEDKFQCLTVVSKEREEVEFSDNGHNTDRPLMAECEPKMDLQTSTVDVVGSPNDKIIATNFSSELQPQDQIYVNQPDKPDKLTGSTGSLKLLHTSAENPPDDSKRRAQSLSPCYITEESDINQLGPGAVGGTSTSKPSLQPQLACPVRMRASLTELKSQYRRQLAQQRQTKLQQPGLWTSHDPMDSPLFSTAWITAVLPQKKESKSMEFSRSVDLAAINTVVPCLEEHQEPLDCQASSEEDVFLNELAAAQCEPVDSEMSMCLSPSKTIHTDLDLIGAVHSWQAKAVWASEPTNSELVESNEVEDSGPNGPCAELSSQDLTKSKAVAETAVNVNRKPKLWELAERATAKYTNTFDSAVMVTEDATSDVSASFYSARSHAAYFGHQMALGNVCCDSVHSDHPKEDSPVRGMYGSLHRTDFTRNLEEEKVVPEKYLEVASADSLRISAPPQHFKKPPWEDATSMFVSRKLRLPSGQFAALPTSQGIGLRLPLSPKRQQFGAQFGLYKTTNYTSAGLSTFSDRVQFVGLARHALTRHSLNCA
ncbi:TBC domain protein [Paragonimus heterotremus]|uniref:TBC domain protein n=1 Tax=Paragonimus heterotremus TaxID=100268 RepID=A0A8J4WKG3_9TREM|nr:TBC domain protein [Paragonimus heterotremus]